MLVRGSKVERVSTAANLRQARCGGLLVIMGSPQNSLSPLCNKGNMGKWPENACVFTDLQEASETCTFHPSRDPLHNKIIRTSNSSGVGRKGAEGKQTKHCCFANCSLLIPTFHSHHLNWCNDDLHFKYMKTKAH